MEEGPKQKEQHQSHGRTRQRPRQRVSNSTSDGAESLVADGLMVASLETSSDDALPPAYGEHHDHIKFSQPGIDAGAEATVDLKVQTRGINTYANFEHLRPMLTDDGIPLALDDGRININICTKNRRLVDLLAPKIDNRTFASPALPPAYIPPGLGHALGQPPLPVLNVVIQIVGSRGDVQPFLALGKVLKETYGHTIRIATHATFKSFVEENGLEFFNIGGDPAELMAFMVKHPGLMPGIDALKSGEITRRRRGIEQMLLGCWRSCIEAGDGMGPPPKQHRVNAPLDFSQSLPGDEGAQPFVADAIIANPPSFAHIHIAEKMGIPLHMMFTMPWSPTRAFPHPLANVQSSNADDLMTNYLTYTLVDMMTWQGLGDIINRFRKRALELPALSFVWAPGSLNRLKIPYTYCWSPALIPKPNDWGVHIDVSGFCFLDLASSYIPDPDLAAFLEAGPPPVYIGFGSIVVEDPNSMTQMIFEAIRLAGIRALVSKGWGGLGAEDGGNPESVFMLGNVPHDWLFERVSAVVHHGGAGTTATGIKAGKPTLVVPFFGDQPFWGAMIAKANAGPEPILYKDLTAEKLAEAIKICLEPNTLARAAELGTKIRKEAGTDVGARSFHRHMDIENMRCYLAPSRVATWRVKRTKVRLSPLAMSVLVDAGLLEYKDVKLCRHVEYNTEDQPSDPVTAGAIAMIGDMSDIGLAIADVPRKLFQTRRIKDSQGFEMRNVAKAPTEPTPASKGVVSQTASMKADVWNKAVHRGDHSATVTAGSNQSLLHHPSDPRPSHVLLTNPNSATAFNKQTVSAADCMEQSSIQSMTRSSVDKTQSAGLRREPSPSVVSLDTTIAAGQSLGRAVSTGVKAPMNFALGLAKGFRNMPRLYNDDTVRPSGKVTDLTSGIRLAGKELGLGFFDGITGLVTQPIRGAGKEGASGFVKGIGKGIGGLIAKPAAGIYGVPAYMMQGVHAEVSKMFSTSFTNYAITSRIVRGDQDRVGAGEEEKAEIIIRWNNIKSDLKHFHALKRTERKKAQKAKMGAAVPSHTPVFPSSQVKAHWPHGQNLPSEGGQKLVARERDSFSSTIAIAASNEFGVTPSLVSGDVDYETAIQASVRETSRGDGEEDAVIEAAIRKSIEAMRAHARARDVLLDPLLNASELLVKDASIFYDEEYRISDAEYQDLIERAVQQSLASQILDYDSDQDFGTTAAGTSTSAAGLASDGVEEGFQHGADIRRAIDDSNNIEYLLHEDYEASLQQAIELSKQDLGCYQTRRNEEDIVLEYMKKQSLAEKEYRQIMNERREKWVVYNGGDDEDEELRRALNATEASSELHIGNDAGTSARDTSNEDQTVGTGSE
ncbi:hypothetical protein E4U60_006317 [Claviceps pazoutovae]|uniref:Glycosyltransferase family 28 N-terminal domain-containing protein n=1 Tax=Claviceps pazoutovae TaxID=1649127 RepID=A0A9P7SEP3_9HYPO|nr:hypothetical protein E4U60_006317 [Claviceps pazoutovae]